MEPLDDNEVTAAVGCELCEAARLTDWFFEDDLCWVAECESCSVPMVVWKKHDPDPPEEVRVVLRRVLSRVVEEHLGWGSPGDDWWFDDRLRSIPTHYHAHARRRFRGW